MKNFYALITKRYRKTSIALVAALLTVFFAADDCDGETTSQDKESKVQQSNYDTMTKNQPAHSMSYSVTRDTINFWVDTWGKKDTLSYNYLVSGGKPYAFVVLKGLPVSYCTGLTPPYTFVGTPNDDSDVKDQKVPAPGLDAVYYSGGDCSRYYGRDATTGTYVEFTAGADTTLVTRTEPLPLNLYADALPLGETSAQESQNLPKTETVPSP